MSDTWAALVHRAADEALAGDETNAVAVCDLISERHPEAFAEHGKHLARSGLYRQVTALFRKFSDDDNGQLAFPGLQLPTAIPFPREDNTTGYVRADKASWWHLKAGEDVRDNNVTHASDRLRDYRRSLDLLRPYMEDHPERTVADAIRLAREEDAS